MPGLEPNVTENNIVGGRRATIQEYPWQVALFDSFRDVICGGSIIGKRLIVTAQHCTATTTIAYVGAGESLMSTFQSRLSLLIPVEATINYPQYVLNSQGTMGKDAAILVLARDLNFSKNIQAIPVAETSDAPFMAPGKEAFVSGWGTTSFGHDQYPDHLRAAKVKIVSQQFAESTGVKPIYSDQVAAGQFPGAGRSKTTRIYIYRIQWT
jgi:secreted trypsin-like serine protease